MGTSGGGALRYDGQTFQSIRLGPSALENKVEAVLCDRRGRLWFGTRAGLVAYQPGHTPPRLVIREAMAGTLLAAPEAISCPESTPEIRIHFQGISFRTGAGQMRYSHRLLGHSPVEQWSAFTTANTVAYSALPVGEYRFEVRTMDRDGLMSEVASLEIQILPDAKTERIHALENVLRATDHVVHSQSWAMRQVMEQTVRVAETAMTVLVLGETGTGKGLLAQTIHETSTRRKRPFIQVNCGALPVGLVESELFGHEKGAFTGAASRQLGRFELADGGTLFLDEIGDLPLESQRVLLHILEENALTRVGGEQPVSVDVRVIAATNRDLRQAIQEGTFREDLFYRLSVFTLELPPLRQRQEDIPALAVHFAERYAQHLQRPVPTLDEWVVAHLQGYAWPGNVRELEHQIQRAVLLCKGGIIRVEDLSPPAVGDGELSSAERRNWRRGQSNAAGRSGGRKAANPKGPASDPLAGLWCAWCGCVVGYAPREAALPHAEIRGYDARSRSAGRKSLYRRPTANESRGGPQKICGNTQKICGKPCDDGEATPRRKPYPIILSIMFSIL